MPDHYEVLGIDREADDAAVRQAYRRLARTFHPDVNDNPEARAQFEAVQSAYETLSEPLRRQAYDALQCEKALEIVPEATHLFEEPGALEQVSALATRWFVRHFEPGATM